MPSKPTHTEETDAPITGASAPGKPTAPPEIVEHARIIGATRCWRHVSGSYVFKEKHLSAVGVRPADFTEVTLSDNGK